MYTNALQALRVTAFACCDWQLRKAYPQEALGNRIAVVSQQAGQESFGGHSQCLRGEESGVPSAQTNNGLLQATNNQLMMRCVGHREMAMTPFAQLS